MLLLIGQRVRRCHTHYCHDNHSCHCGGRGRFSERSPHAALDKLWLANAADDHSPFALGAGEGAPFLGRRFCRLTRRPPEPIGYELVTEVVEADEPSGVAAVRGLLLRLAAGENTMPP